MAKQARIVAPQIEPSHHGWDTARSKIAIAWVSNSCPLSLLSNIHIPTVFVSLHLLSDVTWCCCCWWKYKQGEWRDKADRLAADGMPPEPNCMSSTFCVLSPFINFHLQPLTPYFCSTFSLTLVGTDVIDCGVSQESGVAKPTVALDGTPCQSVKRRCIRGLENLYDRKGIHRQEEHGCADIITMTDLIY